MLVSPLVAKRLVRTINLQAIDDDVAGIGSELQPACAIEAQYRLHIVSIWIGSDGGPPLWGATEFQRSNNPVIVILIAFSAMVFAVSGL